MNNPALDLANLAGDIVRDVLQDVETIPQADLEQQRRMGKRYRGYFPALNALAPKAIRALVVAPLTYSEAKAIVDAVLSTCLNLSRWRSRLPAESPVPETPLTLAYTPANSKMSSPAKLKKLIAEDARQQTSEYLEALTGPLIDAVTRARRELLNALVVEAVADKTPEGIHSDDAPRHVFARLQDGRYFVRFCGIEDRLPSYKGLDLIHYLLRQPNQKHSLLAINRDLYADEVQAGEIEHDQDDEHRSGLPAGYTLAEHTEMSH